VTVDGFRDYLYRHTFRHYKGEIPKELMIRHMCNNSFCINPEHLEIGTHQDNIDDMVKSGNSAKGTKNPMSKYSIEQIKEVHKLLCENKILITEISKVTGVHRAMILAIKNGKRWSWLFEDRAIDYKQGNMKYNQDKKDEIKEDIKNGLKQREIVEKHGIGRGLVVRMAKELREQE
jgi:hypothetical protein